MLGHFLLRAPLLLWPRAGRGWSLLAGRQRFRRFFSNVCSLYGLPGKRRLDCFPFWDYELWSRVQLLLYFFQARYTFFFLCQEMATFFSPLPRNGMDLAMFNTGPWIFPAKILGGPQVKLD